MYCNYCRSLNPDDAIYCSLCGRNIGLATDKSPDQTQTGKPTAIPPLIVPSTSVPAPGDVQNPRITAFQSMAVASGQQQDAEKSSPAPERASEAIESNCIQLPPNLCPVRLFLHTALWGNDSRPILLT